MAVSLKYVARGIGGVDEMARHLDESKVQFGIVRFKFGSGRARASLITTPDNLQGLYDTLVPFSAQTEHRCGIHHAIVVSSLWFHAWTGPQPQL
jgi:hypothetical protein